MQGQSSKFGKAARTRFKLIRVGQFALKPISEAVEVFVRADGGGEACEPALPFVLRRLVEA